MNTPENIYGFTLIELMVTVAILAIIAAIAVPSYNGYIQGGRFAECNNELSAIQLAEEQFFLENNAYFVGATVSALEASSNGLYRSAYSDAATLAAANCDLQVVAGTTADDQSYSITATGKNKLSSSDTKSLGN